MNPVAKLAVQLLLLLFPLLLLRLFLLLLQLLRQLLLILLPGERQEKKTTRGSTLQVALGLTTAVSASCSPHFTQMH